MKRLILAVLLIASATSAGAVTCTRSTIIMPDGTVLICSTCGSVTWCA